MITTIDPKLTALNLSQYPPLPANMDPTKIEEIRRTVYVGNLDSSVCYKFERKFKFKFKLYFIIDFSRAIIEIF